MSFRVKQNREVKENNRVAMYVWNIVPEKAGRCDPEVLGIRAEGKTQSQVSQGEDTKQSGTIEEVPELALLIHELVTQWHTLQSLSKVLMPKARLELVGDNELAHIYLCQLYLSV